MTSETFTFIDTNTGFVWGSGEGDGFLAACREMHEGIASQPEPGMVREYIEVSRGQADRASYSVYEGGIAAGDDRPGDDRSLIQEIEGRGVIGYVLVMEVEQ